MALLLLATLVVFAPLEAAGNVRPQSSSTLSVPAGFTDALVVAVPAPTAFDFHPDGRMFVATQPGQLYIVRNGVLVSTPALDLSAQVCNGSERGLLGIALDPAVQSNGFVYLFYTSPKGGGCEGNPPPVNRVSRFTLTGDTIAPTSELVLLDEMPSPNGNHNGGDVQIGNDGNLYVSIGDGGCDYAGGGCAGGNDAARDLHTLTGKILRITRTGDVPADNPFTGSGTARCNAGSITPGTTCQEIFATGLRNPFRMAFDPNTPPGVTSFRINDVGQNTWEEIDVGLAGADYGWNEREGHCATGSTSDCGTPPAGMTNPIHDYDHSTGCASITGGAFVPNGVWPSEFDGDYLFSDYVCGTIFRLEPDGSGGYVQTSFVTDLGRNSAVHLGFGPFGTGADASQALYYTSYDGGGQVRRISNGISNGLPVASFTATPPSGPSPLSVTFDGSASNDPENQPLSFEWAFGDGDTSATGPSVEHTYDTPGTFTATLVVRNADGDASSPASVVMVVESTGNTPPTPSIETPTQGSTYAVGEQVILTGEGTDAEDGDLAAEALSWQVLLHHVPVGGTEHSHPLATGTGDSLSFTFPSPEDLAATAGSWVEAILTATDSQGNAATVTRRIDPTRVSITLATSPTGQVLSLETPSDPVAFVTGPFTFTSWEGWRLTIGASPIKGTRPRFRFWSDGGTRIHTVVTPDTATTYTATFGGGKQH